MAVIVWTSPSVCILRFAVPKTDVHPSCLPVWIDVPDCSTLKANSALPSPLPDPPSHSIKLPFPRLAWLSSFEPDPCHVAHPSADLLSRGKRGRLSLGSS